MAGPSIGQSNNSDGNIANQNHPTDTDNSADDNVIDNSSVGVPTSPHNNDISAEQPTTSRQSTDYEPWTDREVEDPQPSRPGAYRVSGGNNNDVSANTNIAEQRRDGSSQLTDEQVGEFLGNLGIPW